jgi:prophage regulatory protein
MSKKRFLRPKEAWDRAGLSRSSCYRLEAVGQFPKRVKIGMHATGYVSSEIEDWIDGRIANRDSGRGAQ